MSAFAVIRHTETGGVGTASADAMEHLRANGWVRVSEYRAEPSAFHLPEFADATDLDAVDEPQHDEPQHESTAEPEPTTAPEAKPAKTTKRSQA